MSGGRRGFNGWSEGCASRVAGMRFSGDLTPGMTGAPEHIRGWREASGLKNQKEMQEDSEAMHKKQEVLLANQKELLVRPANQEELLAQSSLALRNRYSPSHIPTAPNTVVFLEGQLCAVRNMLLQSPTRYVVIWGIGGIGKTTLARALINDPMVHRKFEKCSFVTISQNPNIIQCQKQIWDALVGTEPSVQFTTAEEGRLRLQAALKDECTFIILDDVWDATHVEQLDVVSSKSRVVITSQNAAVATCVNARCYTALALGEAESMELFCQQAFTNGQPWKWQIPFVKDIVQKCGGLPLALEVMGVEARGFSMGEEGGSVPIPSAKKTWQRAVEGIKSDGVVSKGVFDRVFKMSFDSLEDRHRAALLDLAMLPEDHEARESDVVDMQYCNGLSTDEAYEVLEELAEKSLIIRTGKYALDVHDFQSTGFVTCRLHVVVRDSALRVIAELPIAERDRLVSSHLKKLAFKGRRLCATKFSTTHSIGEDRKLDLWQLDMPDLQAVVLRNAKMLDLPVSLLAMNLVVIDLTSSGIVSLPTQVTCLQSAKVLRLDYCDKLVCLPSELGNMEQLIVLSMRGCRGIFELPKSIGRLSNLTKLLMPSCGIAHFLPIEEGTLQSLTMLDLSRCFGLKCLPPSLGVLSSLVALDLAGCWQLTSLPSIIGEWAHLEVLLLHGCESLMELPNAVTLLGNLADLDVQGCTKLTCLPEDLADGCPELRILRLQQNSAMAFPEFVVDFEQLQVLGLHKDWTLPKSTIEKLQDQQVSLEQKPTEECISTEHWDRDTPLHWAAGLGLTEAVEFHLRETNVDFVSRDWYTPLHRASEGGHTATAKLLLDRGASVDAVDKVGYTPLHRASEGGHTATADLLLDRGASVDSVDWDWYTPLHRASQGGHTATAKLLLDRGASVNAVAKDEYTPLHRASQGGHTATAKLLLDRGASVDAVAKVGYTPLHRASEGGHTATADLLLDSGASVDAVDWRGRTPLSYAATNGDNTTAELLLSRGAHMYSVDKGAKSVPVPAGKSRSVVAEEIQVEERKESKQEDGQNSTPENVLDSAASGFYEERQQEDLVDAPQPENAGETVETSERTPEPGHTRGRLLDLSLSGDKGGTSGQQWIETVDPGVSVVSQRAPVGVTKIKKMRFSKQKFTADRAQNWWQANQQRLVQHFNLVPDASLGDQSPFGKAGFAGIGDTMTDVPNMEDPTGRMGFPDSIVSGSGRDGKDKSSAAGLPSNVPPNSEPGVEEDDPD